MAEMSFQEVEKKALDALSVQPENFRWTVGGNTYRRDDLVKAVEFGFEIAKLVMESGLGNPRNGNQLGKRYRCLVCSTEILCTKASDGNSVCCDQDMLVQVPKPVPSSD